MQQIATTATMQPYATAAGNITDRALLVKFQSRQWGIRRALTSDERETAARSLSADAAWIRTGKVLIDPEAVKPMDQIIRAAGDFHRARTLPWLDDATRLILTAGYPDYDRGMAHYQDELGKAVAKFAVIYPQLVDNARRPLNGLWKWSDYPAQWEIADRYSLGYNPRFLENTPDPRIQLSADAVNAIRQSVEHQITEAIQAATLDVAERIRATVGHMAETLRAYTPATDTQRAQGTFKDSLVANVKELSAILPTLNITQDPRLDAIGRNMAELTFYTPNSLRDSKRARDEVAAKADEIMRQMQEMVA